MESVESRDIGLDKLSSYLHPLQVYQAYDLVDIQAEYVTREAASEREAARRRVRTLALVNMRLL